MTIRREDYNDFYKRNGMGQSPITTNIDILSIGTSSLHTDLNYDVLDSSYSFDIENLPRVGMLVTLHPTKPSEVVIAGGNQDVKQSVPYGIIVGTITRNLSDSTGAENDNNWTVAKVQNTNNIIIQTSRSIIGMYLQVDPAYKQAGIGSFVYYQPNTNLYELVSTQVANKSHLFVGYTKSFVVGGNGLPYYVQVNATY